MDLQQFLDAYGLGGYITAINNELAVQTLQQLHGVTEAELKDIRMPKPDILRLKKALKKDPAKTGKIRDKKITRSSSDVSKQILPGGAPSGEGRLKVHTPTKGSNLTIPAQSLTIVEERLVEGLFTDVYKGTWANGGQKVDVIVKKIQKLEVSADFSKDCLAMHALQHENVCAFYGVSYGQDYTAMLVSEWAPLGSLQACIKSPSLRSSFPLPTLCELTKQIVSAMAYLASCKFVHRNLAACNVLVFSPTKVKVGDCGVRKAMSLTKDFFLEDDRLSIAWLAPETITHQKWSQSSDVWSFAVTLWEMFSYGRQPWELSTPAQIAEAVTAPQDKRLGKPDWCPASHYVIMERCWNSSPDKRPSFSSLAKDLSTKPLIRMRALRDSAGDPAADMLSFKENDEIFVLDMKPANAPAWHYWKGVTNVGVPGFFNPTDAVDQTRMDPAAATSPPKDVNLRPKKSLKNQSRKSRTSKAKLTTGMIGWPKDDFRHTGHIGMDGVTFGNIDHIAAEMVDGVPKSRSSLQGSTADITTDGESAASVSSRGESASIRTPGEITPIRAPAEVFTPPRPAGELATAPPPDELEDFSIPDLSLSVSDFSLGTSFIDEMMKGLHTDRFSKKRRSSGSSNGSAEAHSPGAHVNGGGKKSNGLLPGRERKDSSSNEEGAKGVYVLKEMSAADQKMLDEAIELTNQFSANRLQSDHSPKDDEPGTPSGKSKSSKFFKFPSASSKKSPKSEKKTFTDDLNSKSHQLGCTTPEAEAAYNVLVAGASSQEEVSAGRHSQEDVNAGRRLKMEGHGPSKGQHAPVAKRPSTEHNPPLPPRQSRVGGTSPPSRRPTDMPPLPPVGRRRSAHDDLRDLPATPPPPLPSRGGAMDEDRLEELGLYNSQDPFWRVDMRLSGEEAEEDEDDGLSLPMQGKYKSRSDNVSYEDLTDFSSQNNGGNDPGKTHRVMQKVLGDVTTSERENALLATNGDVHKAVKYVRLRQLMRLSMGDINRCKEALMYSNWIVQNAVDYMLDHPPPSPDTVDV